MIIIDSTHHHLSIIIIIIGDRGCELVRYRDHELPSRSWLGHGKLHVFPLQRQKCSKMLQNRGTPHFLTGKSYAPALALPSSLRRLPGARLLKVGMIHIINKSDLGRLRPALIFIIIGGRGCELVRYCDREPASWSWLALGHGKSRKISLSRENARKCPKCPPPKKHDFSNPDPKLDLG